MSEQVLGIITSLTPENLQTLVALSLLLITLLTVWSLALTVLTWRSLTFAKKLFGDTQQEELKAILMEHINRVGSVQLKLNDLEKALHQIRQQDLKHLQKVGVVRFNPFDDTGSDQSFALAILDENDNGLVISSLHGRERTRTYAKGVKRAQPENYPFSDEEIKAIDKARKSHRGN